MAHTLTTAQLCFKTYQNLTKLNTDTYYRYKHCDTPEIFIVSTCLGDLGIQFLQYKTVKYSYRNHPMFTDSHLGTIHVHDRSPHGYPYQLCYIHPPCCLHSHYQPIERNRCVEHSYMVWLFLCVIF